MADKGIDISYFQGTIDFNKVKSDGVKFIIPRCGYGKSTVDKKFYNYINGAKAAGIAIPGIYHFSYAYTIDMAKAEADFAVSCAKNASLPTDTIIFFDFEYDSVDYAKKQGVTISPTLCINMTAAFCNRVKELGYKAGVYANTDYYKRMYNNGSGIPSSATFWLADWTGKANQIPAQYHQYTEKGTVNGISGNVDLDWFYGTISEPKALKKADDKVVADVIMGKYGNGEVRKQKLFDAGYDYNSVQSAVNEMMKAKKDVVKPEPEKKQVTDKLVLDIVAGVYGNGDDRKKKLESEGYDYDQAQYAVNKYLKESKPALSPAKAFDNGISAPYRVNASMLNVRYIPGVLTDNNVMAILKKDERVQCWGYYTQVGNSKWYLIQRGSLVGFVDSHYLTRIR